MMKIEYGTQARILALFLLSLPLCAIAQDDPFALEGVEEEDVQEQPEIENEATIGVYYLDDDSFRYGKYTGLIDEGAEPLLDFRLESRPIWESGDTARWRLEGTRLGLDSRRVVLDYNDQGRQKIEAVYREIPNYRFSDGMTPYRGIGSANLTLPSSWAIAPGSSNTEGFLALNESLTHLEIDTQRRKMEVEYDLKFAKRWNLSLDFSHETKRGERSIAGIFGYTGGNPRAVLLPAPVDYTTDIFEAMFEYTNTRVQFGIGGFASFFSNDKTSLVWQNAYGRQSQWDESVTFPNSQGRLALEPDNSYIQFKAYGGVNLAPSTRLTADVSVGQMKQDDALLPYTINPELVVHTPVPLNDADAQIDTMTFNARLTTQLARRLVLSVNYRYDDRDNETPRAVYPYIGGDSQDQRPYEDGRINLPYSYTEHAADAIATYRFSGNVRLKAGAEYSDYSREYSEVSDAEEWTWLAGLRWGAWETTSFSIDFRNSERDVTAYHGNVPLVLSHLPGTVEEDEFENHPLLRKYFLTDRERDEYRARVDFFPTPEFNFGLAGSWFEDDYGDGYFGLNEAKVRAVTVDGGWYPNDTVALLAYYTRESYDAEQSSRTFSPFPPTSVDDPDRNWFADTDDEVDTWNLSLSFSDVGGDGPMAGMDIGFDYTYSNTESRIDVTAPVLETTPLPMLRSKLRSISAWASFDTGTHSSLRFTIENSDLDTDDFALDGVAPDELANVLTFGESAANYDILLITGSWTYRF